LSANLDLMPCVSLPVFGEHILGIGWLDKLGRFPTGPTSSEVFVRLLEFIRNPWQPFVAMGIHECEICQFHGEASGSANLYIPFDGKIYVCPELITHYINAHLYLPPSIFCDAVLACPPMNSMEYKRLLIAYNGQVLWKPSSEWREL
jgi:hypothetical protein